MKKRYNILRLLMLLAIVSVALCGCQRDSVDSRQNLIDGKVAIKAVVNTVAQTRLSLTDNEDESVIEVEWSKGDSFSIFDGSEKFVGKFEWVSDNNFVATTYLALSEAEYKVRFPYIEGDDERTLSERDALALESTTQTQNGSLAHINSALRMSTASDYYYSPSSDESIYFNHDYSVLKMTYSLEEGVTPTQIVFSDGDVDYTLNFEEIEYSESYTSYIPISPSSSGERDLTFTVTTSDGNTSIYTTTITKALFAGKCYTADIPEFTTNIIEIITAEQLAKIGNDSDYPLDGDYILINNISLSEYSNWTSIGSKDNPFTGTFNGADHTISNLTISSESDYQGLFGDVDGATIKNVKINEPSITSTGTYVGALIGRAYYGSVENCSVEGGLVSGDSAVGAVVGTAYYSYISSCSNTSSVNSVGTNNGLVSGSGFYTGGIVGYCSVSSSISSCYNTGIVTGYVYVGGIAGDSFSSIISCYNTGAVSGGYVGGIVGSCTSSITSCYNTGVVSGATSGGVYIGGVVGQSTSSSASIISCYNTGLVKRNSEDDYIGSIAGSCHSNATITSCYYLYQVNNDASSGIGSNTSSDYDYVTLTSVSDLNGCVGIMNDALQAIDSEVRYTAGSPSTTNLPHLMGENLLYTGTGAVVSTSWKLEDFSSTNYPTDTYDWVISDNEANEYDLDGLNAAILSVCKSGDVSLTFENLEAIPAYAFLEEYQFSGNISVSAPKATSVGDYAFAYCSCITTISLPSVTTIGSYAFAGNEDITEISLATDSGVKLESISSDAFEYADISNIYLSIGSSNTEYLDKYTLTIGDFSETFASVSVVLIMGGDSSVPVIPSLEI